MHFSDLVFIVLVIPVIAAVFFLVKLRGRMKSSFRFSSKTIAQDLGSTLRARLSGKMIYLRALCLVLIVMAMTRPQLPIEETKVFVEGVDIVLVLDTSGSMRALDFEMGGKRYDRLTVAKNVVENFIGKRVNDRIGLVAFSATAYTVCPLTLDHDWLLKNLERVSIGMIEDGTNIGSGIVGALNRLKGSKAKDKVIIFLTDGRNNTGEIAPMSGAEAAKALGVRIYTIGAGTKGMAPYPMKDLYGQTVLQPVEVDIDDELLTRVADVTGGKYFRATDTDSLWNTYKEIDKLEKTEIEEIGYNRYEELFGVFLFPAVILLFIELFLTNTVLRRIP